MSFDDYPIEDFEEDDTLDGSDSVEFWGDPIDDCDAVDEEPSTQEFLDHCLILEEGWLYPADEFHEAIEELLEENGMKLAGWPSWFYRIDFRSRSLLGHVSPSGSFYETLDYQNQKDKAGTITSGSTNLTVMLKGG